MKKLFEKDEIWFAVVWIVIYVVGFGNADLLSEAIGVPKLLTCLLGLVMSGILLGFLERNGLKEYFGLCPVRGGGRDCLWFVPLVAISSVNLWSGVQMNASVTETVLYIISMCFVALLEEVIFRGLLFRGMWRSGSLTAAIVVSSLTFGMGHIVNLLLGEPLFETLLQLVYASAIGFCFTALFFVSGSILPCILSHAVVNATSIFAVEPGEDLLLVTALVQTALGLGYGAWLLRCAGKTKKEL